MKVLRIFFVIILVGTVFVTAKTAFSKQTAPRCPRCNIVVIMIDNLRADTLPCYGYKFNTAPRICKFGEQNVLFSRAFSASSWTLPSSMSFFTSLYPSSHGIGITLYNSLSPGVVPLPLQLKKLDFDTTFVSTNQPSVGFKQGLESGFTSVRITPKNLDNSLPITLTAIDDMKISNSKRKPAFLFIHSDGVHEYPNHLTQAPERFPLDPDYAPPRLPILPFSESLRQSAIETVLEHLSFGLGSDMPLDQYRKWHTLLTSAPTLKEAEQVFLELPEDDQEIILSHIIGPKLSDENYHTFLTYMRHVYDDYVLKTDAYIGHILSRLEKNNLMRNTIVIITSEHGELLGEGELIGHGIKMYNPEINVPFIMHIPTVRANRIDNLTQSIDIYPSLMDLLGQRISGALQGISFMPLISGDPNAKTNPYVITEWTNRWESRTIQNADWKLFEDTPNVHGDLYELYRLTDDSGEKNIVTKEYSKKKEELQQTLHDILYLAPDYPPTTQPFPDWIDEQHRKNLIETGYFNRK